MLAINRKNTTHIKSIILKLIDKCKTEKEKQLFDEEIDNFLYDKNTNLALSNDKEKLLEYKDNPKLQPISIDERIKALHEILGNISTIINYYRGKKLFTRIGTDSTSRVGRLAGMGLAYIQCLPYRTIKELKKNTNDSRMIIPIRKEIRMVDTYIMPHANEHVSFCKKILRKIAVSFLAIIKS